MNKALVFSAIISLLFAQISCTKTDDPTVNEIQREEEMDRGDIMEKDSYSEDREVGTENPVAP